MGLVEPSRHYLGYVYLQLAHDSFFLRQVLLCSLIIRYCAIWPVDSAAKYDRYKYARQKKTIKQINKKNRSVHTARGVARKGVVSHFATLDE